MFTYEITVMSGMTHQVWQGSYKSSATDEALLSELFRYFNRVDEADVTRLAMHGFTQPSMSTGDIVGIAGENIRPRTFICKAAGWQEVERF